MKYFLIAGEASGDIHAAQVIAALKSRDENAQFVFLGGDLMEEASGVKPLIHYREMAYMGFSEVLRHLPSIYGNMRKAKAVLTEQRPDAVILIDYPSFNLKIAKLAHKLGIKTFYYISPKVWAWKEYRVKQIKKYIDRMLAIFPFEVEFYKKHDYDVTYVGNPSVQEVKEHMAEIPSREEFLQEHKLRNRPIIALVPGSRKGEIRNNLPIMVATAKQFPQYRAVVAAAPGIDTSFYEAYTTLPLVVGQTFELMAHARAALVTSGTATLECALIGTPQVVCYRSNGSKIAYKIMEKFLKVPFVSLPNLIANRQVIPEMLLHNCTPDLVAEELAKILPDRVGRQNQLDGYQEMKDRLGDNDTSGNAADLIISDLTGK
jgi:lipid-A-disaccharide synthase